MRKLIIPTRHPRQMATCARAYVRAHVRTCAVELTRVTYARTYVRTYAPTYVRTLGRLRAHAVHAYLRKYARTHVRTAKEAKGDVEAEDDGSSSFPPAA